MTPPAAVRREEYAFRNAPLRCGSCGSPVEEGAVHCAACGASLPGSEGRAGEAEGSILTAAFECQSCGAMVACEPGRGSYACAFCGSTVVAEVELARLVPEFVLPFRISREEAEAALDGWFGGGFFTPRDVRTAGRIEKLQGVYLPFWTFSMKAESTWEADIGEYWWETVSSTYTDSQGKRSTRTRRKRHTEWHPLTGGHHCYYHHHLVSGSTGLPQAEAEEVYPFELTELRRYRPQYLAGWVAETFSVTREAALAECQRQFRETEGERIAKFLPGDTSSGLEWTTTFSEVSDDLLLLPFWIAAFDYRGKPYRFVLNGQTGITTGMLPISWWKVLATALLVGTLLVLLSVYLSQP